MPCAERGLGGGPLRPFLFWQLSRPTDGLGGQNYHSFYSLRNGLQDFYVAIIAILLLQWCPSSILGSVVKKTIYPWSTLLVWKAIFCNRDEGSLDPVALRWTEWGLPTLKCSHCYFLSYPFLKYALLNVGPQQWHYVHVPLKFSLQVSSGIYSKKKLKLYPLGSRIARENHHKAYWK